MRTISRLTLAVVALALSALPAVAQVRQFHDWLAACDNARTCVAFGLREDTTDRYLRIARGAEPDAAAKVSIVLEGKFSSVQFRFDGRTPVNVPDDAVAGHYNQDLNKTVIDIPLDAALLDALRSAKALIVTADQTALDPISLSGAVASLLWIDEQQKRLDTVTALIRHGAKPPSAVPAPPALPVVHAAKPDHKPDKPFPQAVLAKGRPICGDDDPNPEAGEANALSGNLVAYWFECRAMSGAYNSWSGLVVAPRDKPQAARVVQLPYPPAARVLEGVEKHLVVNAGFDEKTLTLTMFVKSRGPGDCGSSGEWVFDGKDFRLTRYQSMPLCAGLVSDEWPVIFRAKVE